MQTISSTWGERGVNPQSRWLQFIKGQEVSCRVASPVLPRKRLPGVSYSFVNTSLTAQGSFTAQRCYTDSSIWNTKHPSASMSASDVHPDHAASSQQRRDFTQIQAFTHLSPEIDRRQSCSSLISGSFDGSNTSPSVNRSSLNNFCRKVVKKLHYTSINTLLKPSCLTLLPYIKQNVDVNAL